MACHLCYIKWHNNNNEFWSLRPPKGPILFLPSSSSMSYLVLTLASWAISSFYLCQQPWLDQHVPCVNSLLIRGFVDSIGLNILLCNKILLFISIYLKLVSNKITLAWIIVAAWQEEHSFICIAVGSDGQEADTSQSKAREEPVCVQWFALGIIGKDDYLVSKLTCVIRWQLQAANTKIKLRTCEEHGCPKGGRATTALSLSKDSEETHVVLREKNTCSCH